MYIAQHAEGNKGTRSAGRHGTWEFNLAFTDSTWICYVGPGAFRQFAARGRFGWHADNLSVKSRVLLDERSADVRVVTDAVPMDGLPTRRSERGRRALSDRCSGAIEVLSTLRRLASGYILRDLRTRRCMIE